jgi:hypothetical protein
MPRHEHNLVGVLGRESDFLRYPRQLRMHDLAQRFELDRPSVIATMSMNPSKA